MTTIISRGGHFVGEGSFRGTGVTPRQKRQALPEDTYESEDHLLWALAQEQNAQAAHQEKYDNLRAYIKANALKKREEIEYHRLRPDWNPCPTCSVCRCGRGRVMSFRCLCGDGKKMLGPDRIVFFNNSIKQDWATGIWQVGVGLVPRRNQSTKTSLVGASGLD